MSSPMRVAQSRHFLIAIVTLSLTLPCRGWSQQSAEDLLRQALDASKPASGADYLAADAKLYNLTMRLNGSVTDLLQTIKKRAGDNAQSAAVRQQARWLYARLLWRLGDHREARAELKALIAESKDARIQLNYAQLLDADGQQDEAAKIYRQALELTKDPETERRIQIRLSLLTKPEKGKVTALSTYASKQSNVEFKNRAAVVLALQGTYNEALKLFSATGEGAARFKREIRQAEWSLSAGKLDEAKKYAWSARKTATLKRDRRYALTVLAQAHRESKTLDKLIAKFAKEGSLDRESREMWIDLLRETGEIDEALKLFHAANKDASEFDVALRRELLEICRESGQEETLVKTYEAMIKQEPERVEWREGLSRFLLELGKRAQAGIVWRPFLHEVEDAAMLLQAAQATSALGLNDLSKKLAERSISMASKETGEKATAGSFQGLLFLFQLERRQGNPDKANETLQRFDTLAPANAAQRMLLAEAYEQMGRQDLSISVLQRLRKARGEKDASEDLDMRLAWLLSEVGKEQESLELWLDLWRRVESVGRLRYVEDRLMSTASRLGNLADIAIELEEKLAAGTATKRDSGMLVRLYSKAGDPVSAAEITEEYMKQSGGTPVKTLVEKARIYVSCNDFYNYEKTVRQLIKIDPEGAPDYYRQLAMSHLERGKRGEARQVLKQLRKVDATNDSAEFEAGVLSLAGLRDEALVAYRKGLASYPDRIDTYLLLAKTMNELGRNRRAIGMFQFLAETAVKDDLFTIAIDGLLNAQAPPPVLRWARRITFERLAGRHEKMYLYQLIADLSEELRDQEMMSRAIASSLPIAGERRVNVLRELMDLATARRRTPDRLMYGRRLIASGEIVPPQVYLDLGDAFLSSGDVRNAEKTFQMAEDVPDQAAFEQKIAGAFEKGRYLSQALTVYQRSLLGQSGNVNLLAKVGELHEQLGRDDLAFQVYASGIDLLLSRRPLQSTKEVKETTTPTAYTYSYQRNVDDFSQYYPRLLKGFLATMEPGAKLETIRSELRAAIEADLKLVMEARKVGKREDGARNYPRLWERARFFRRISFAQSEPKRASDADQLLLNSFPEDKTLLLSLVRERLTWGFIASARQLIDSSGRTNNEQQQARFLLGQGTAPSSITRLSMSEASQLVLPLLIDGKHDQLRQILEKVDLIAGDDKDLKALPTLFSLAIYLKDPDAALQIGRQWCNLLYHSKDTRNPYQITQVLQRCWQVLGEQERSSLLQYVMSLVAEEPKKGRSLIYWLQRYARTLDGFELDTALVKEIIQQQLADNYYYYIPDLFRLIPTDEYSELLRSIVPQLPKTQRAVFIIQLVAGLDAKVDEASANFIVAAFGSSYADAEKRMLSIYFRRLSPTITNLDVATRMVAELMKADQANLMYPCYYAMYLHKQGNLKEALATADKVYARSFSVNKSDYYVQDAIRQLFRTLATDDLNLLFKVHDDYAAKNGNTLALMKSRIGLLTYTNDAAYTLSAVRFAHEKFPNESTFSLRLVRLYQQMGRSIDAVRLLEGMHARNPKSSSYKSQLSSLWRSLKNPLKESQLNQPANKPTTSSTKRGARPAVVAPPVRATRIVPATRATPVVPATRLRPATVAPPVATSSQSRATKAGSTKKAATTKSKSRRTYKRINSPSPYSIKSLVDGGKTDEARQMFRRLWRQFPRYSARSYIRYYYYNPSQFYWPTTSTRPPTTTKPRVDRGGFDELLRTRAVAPKRQMIFEALFDKKFAQAEMVRHLRAMSDAEIQSPAANDVCDGLARSLAREDATKAIAKVIAHIQSGEAGRVDYLLLLAMLEQNPDAKAANTAAVLHEMAMNISPSESGQLRRLAHYHAIKGDKQKALRLYRWCATFSSMATVGQPTSSFIPANQLVTEVVDVLDGEERIQALETILAFAAPEPMAYNRDQFEVLVFETWGKLVPPGEVYSRCKRVCEDALDRSGYVKHRSAIHAARVYAAAGEVEQSLKALEIALCQDIQSTSPIYRSIYRRLVLTPTEYKAIFPESFDGWKGDVAGWVTQVLQTLAKWQQEGRLSTRDGMKLRAVGICRLHQLGETQAARQLLEELVELKSDYANDWLWVVDAAHKMEAHDIALQVERRLLEARHLHVERVADHLRASQKAEGAEAAFGLAERATDLTLHPDVLKLLIELAEKAKKPERKKYWTNIQTQYYPPRKPAKKPSPKSKEKPGKPAPAAKR